MCVGGGTVPEKERGVEEEGERKGHRGHWSVPAGHHVGSPPRGAGRAGRAGSPERAEPGGPRDSRSRGDSQTLAEERVRFAERRAWGKGEGGGVKYRDTRTRRVPQTDVARGEGSWRAGVWPGAGDACLMRSLASNKPRPHCLLGRGGEPVSSPLLDGAVPAERELFHSHLWDRLVPDVHTERMTDSSGSAALLLVS